MTQPQFPARLAFGPFEVNAQAGEMLKSGIRIRLPAQPFHILLLLLEHPGEVITREQLREQIWRDGTFVDFEHGLNSATNKLRRTLGDSAEHPRYIETIPGHGYRFVGELKGRNPTPLTVVARERPSQIRRPLPWRWIAAGATCLLSFFIGWQLHQPPPAAGNWQVTRLTADAGLSDAPALSADGKLLAYSSDRGSDAGRDLYVKQVAGGQPIRLTFDGANNTSPNFSPDGSKIVFHSNRDGGGVYEMPAFGGEMHLLAREGLNPRFSPDGSQVAYWVGAPNVAASVSGSGAVWVVSVAGGQPRKLGPNFTVARFPVWSPDGKNLLVVASASAKAYDRLSIDWWLTPVDRGAAMKTGAFNAFVRAGLHPQTTEWPVKSQALDVPTPYCWLAKGLKVIFSTESGDASNLWQIGLSPVTGKINGRLERLTAGAGNEFEASCASADALAFTNVETGRNLWSLPFDLNSGKPNGALERITQSPAGREHASLSEDGKYVVFVSTQSGLANIWERELTTGKELEVAGSSFVQRFPAISPSAREVAYSSYEYGKRVVYISTPGGVPEK